MMLAWLDCPLKYNYRYVRHLVSGVSRQTAAEFGQGIHAALASWYVDKDVVKATNLFKRCFEEDPEDPKRTHKMGEWILANYHKTYQDQPHKLIANEIPFEVDLPNGNKHIGRIDKILEWDGCLWLMDHKTTWELGAKFFNMAEPNLQFPGYVYAARKLGYPVVGYIVDAILVAKGLLETTSRGRLTPLSRYDVYIADDRLAEWLEVVQRIQGEIKRCEESVVWLPNWGSCTSYGECAYRRIDKEDRGLREAIIAADYKQDVWDPRHNKEKG